MSCVLNNNKCCVRELLLQEPRGLEWANNIVAALDDSAGNILQTSALAWLQKPTITFKETTMHKIMAFDPREGLSEFRRLEFARNVGSCAEVMLQARAARSRSSIFAEVSLL